MNSSNLLLTRQHKWMKLRVLFKMQKNTFSLNVLEDLDEDILMRLEKMNIDRNQARKFITTNQHNTVTTTYYLLLKQKLINGGSIVTAEMLTRPPGSDKTAPMTATPIGVAVPPGRHAHKKGLPEVQKLTLNMNQQTVPHTQQHSYSPKVGPFINYPQQPPMSMLADSDVKTGSLQQSQIVTVQIPISSSRGQSNLHKQQPVYMMMRVQVPVKQVEPPTSPSKTKDKLGTMLKSTPKSRHIYTASDAAVQFYDHNQSSSELKNSRFI